MNKVWAMLRKIRVLREGEYREVNDIQALKTEEAMNKAGIEILR